ncbi:MAG: hypothetical protein IT317_20560 [Anaerolineales bacterium]|nr:hypothetical protein [Anaerolineales bacterium]
MLIALALVGAMLVLSACGPDRTLGYQGRLTDANGLPINGTVSITFKLFTQSSGGSAQFTETQDVTVVNGLFNAGIGDATANGTYDLKGIDPALFAQPLWLEITIEGQTLTPRQKLGGAPYAMTLAPGAIIGSDHEGNGAGGADDTDANYGALTVVAGTGTGFIVGLQSGSTADAIRVCSGLIGASRACPDEEFNVSPTGDVTADGTYYCGANINDGAGTLDESEIAPCLVDSTPADFAEYLPAERALEPGDVLAINPDGQLVRSSSAYQLTVVGVYSTEPSYVGNGQHAGDADYAPLAISGVVPVKVTNENGAIVAGDLLVASSTPGQAMRAGDDAPLGSIIGKALGSSVAESATISMLVALR